MKDWLVSGWERFCFVVTPAELENCLTGFHSVINNAHVPIEYNESSLDEYITLYRELFNKLSCGEKLVWKEDYRLLNTTGLTTVLERCGYDRIHEYKEKLYKRPCFDEPCVNIAPFTLCAFKDKKENDSISTRISYIQYPENTIGMELSYPKMIQYKLENSGQYESLRSTKELDGYSDFVLLKDRVNKITKPLSFEMNGCQIKPKVRISREGREAVSEFYFFRNAENAGIWIT